MIRRTVARSEALPAAERARLLADAAAIQVAVLAVCAVVDGLGPGRADDVAGRR